MAKQNERWAKVCFLINFHSEEKEIVGKFRGGRAVRLELSRARWPLFSVSTRFSRYGSFIKFRELRPTLTRQSSCIFARTCRSENSEKLEKFNSTIFISPGEGVAREALRIAEFYLFAKETLLSYPFRRFWTFSPTNEPNFFYDSFRISRSIFTNDTTHEMKNFDKFFPKGGRFEQSRKI